jgi:hypothetical protein
MKRHQSALLALLAALTLLPVHPVQSQTSSFVIEGADATNTLSLASSPSLEALIDDVATRFVMAFANGNEYYALTPIPVALESLLSAIDPRFVMAFAHANESYDLTPVPTQLEALLEEVVPRFVIGFANSSRQIGLQYPADLIDDDRPPEASTVEVSPSGQTRATVSWTTDEFADSTVECGTQSGTYTLTFSDPLYVKAHMVTLTGLTPETTYHCQASSTDLSGNTYQSEEFSFEQAGESFIHLPLVLRH